MAKPWTPDEVAKPECLDQKQAAAPVAAELGRNPSALAVKAHEFKLLSTVGRRTTEAPTSSGADPGPAGFDWPELSGKQ